MAGLSGFARRRRGRSLNAEVNIINLVDVMLVLLIIFMVTAPILQAGIAVQLPDVASKPIPMSDAVVITVERNGAVSIGDVRQTFSSSRPHSLWPSRRSIHAACRSAAILARPMEMCCGYSAWC